MDSAQCTALSSQLSACFVVVRAWGWTPGEDRPETIVRPRGEIICKKRQEEAGKTGSGMGAAAGVGWGGREVSAAELVDRSRPVVGNRSSKSDLAIMRQLCCAEN